MFDLRRRNRQGAAPAPSLVVEIEAYSSNDSLRRSTSSRSGGGDEAANEEEDGAEPVPEVVLGRNCDPKTTNPACFHRPEAWALHLAASAAYAHLAHSTEKWTSRQIERVKCPLLAYRTRHRHH